MQKLLLLHGALGSQEHFNDLKVVLSADFEIYRFDFKGHGGSEVPERGFSIAGFAQEVLVFMDQNHIENIDVFGYSMGGYVGLYLAKNFPGKVNRLFTFATKWDWNPQSAVRESKMLNPPVIKEKVPKFADSLGALHGEKWEILMQKTAEMMLDLGSNPALNTIDLAEITIPIRIAVGDKDLMVSLEETATLYRSLPNAQLLVMPNTVHPIDRIDIKLLAYQIRNYFS